jgi:hypothetical protein
MSTTCSAHLSISWFDRIGGYNEEAALLNIINSDRLQGSLENRECGRKYPLRWGRDTLYPQKLALISPTRGGLLVGIVRSRTKAMEFF